MAFQLREGSEILPNGDWVRWIERTFGQEDLFVYRHPTTRNYVLCQWLNRDRGICTELRAFMAPPDGWRIGRPTRRELKGIFRPAELVAEEIMKRHAAEKQSEKEALGENKGDVMERAAFHRRQGNELLANWMESRPHMYPGRELGDPDAFDAIKKEFTEKAKYPTKVLIDTKLEKSDG